jgi:hypothetical protein
MNNQFLQKKIVQVSIVSGVLFFILGNQPILKYVSDVIKKTFNIQISGTSLILVHSVLFSLFVGLLTYYVFNPIVSSDLLKEGQQPKKQLCLANYKSIVVNGEVQCYWSGSGTHTMKTTKARIKGDKVKHPFNTIYPQCNPYDRAKEVGGNGECNEGEMCNGQTCVKKP